MGIYNLSIQQNTMFLVLTFRVSVEIYTPSSSSHSAYWVEKVYRFFMFALFPSRVKHYLKFSVFFFPPNLVFFFLQ